MRPGVHKGTLFLGLALIIANGFSSGQFGDLWQVIIHPTTVTPNQPGGPSGTSNPYQTKLKSDIMVLLGEVLFLALLSTIADSSDEAAGATVILVLGLWLVWLMHNGQGAGSFINTVTKGVGIGNKTGS